ncbi:helix-turn-helix transcriptional regulator [Nocardiopsis sp. NRRL B-16309]|uniref:helix-turn-helix domain-containing protein n=1 Tax=Nocardiopsis sp. NRRL B-16309 TaxID=1519494 RepID=UPI0006ADA439|nr:helix-turn-helix transcriptional regulator [Nocardiopsis sp. NRRL B-16309]KOX14078.1 hypothetical protein ADL05_17855 [Nocardiopsis sp. NRRL B-16309]
MPPHKQALLRYGREVQRLRNEVSLTQTALARRVNSSKSQISDIERGKANPSAQLRSALDGAIGFGQLERLWDDLTGGRRPAWLDEIATAVQEAEAVYEYQALAFPSYLQTEGCARALIRSALPWLPPDEISARVRERMDRARHMDESLHPMLWLVIDRSLLSRRYGGPHATREQLAHIAALAERERLTLQVVPTDHPKHPGNSGSFRVLTMRDDPDIAYVESAEEGRVLTNSTSVARRRMLFAALQGVALDPESSLRAIHEEMKRME